MCVNWDVVDNRAPSGGNRLAKLVCVNWSVMDSQAPSSGNRLCLLDIGSLKPKSILFKLVPGVGSTLVVDSGLRIERRSF